MGYGYLLLQCLLSYWYGDVRDKCIVQISSLFNYVDKYRVPISGSEETV